MLAIIKAEWLKEKHSNNRKIIMIIPMVFIVFCLAFSTLMMPNSNHISNFIAIVYNWFPSMLTPIIIALIVSHSITRERKERITDYHRSLNISSKHIWQAKIITNSADISLIYLLILLLALITEGVFLGKTEAFGVIILNALCLIIIDLATVPFIMCLCYLTNQFTSIILNLILAIIGVQMAQTKAWFMFPWSYSFRVTATLLGIHPNGTILPENSSYFNTAIVPFAVILWLILFVLFTVLTCFIYSRKENQK